MYSNADKIEWTLIFVSEFGRKFGLTMKQAFNYLTKRYHEYSEEWPNLSF